ncbi:hypothetical protein D3C73_1205180 [compost metagenome]
MLELVELAWTRSVAKGDQCGQWQQLALVVLDVIAVEPAGVVAVGPFDLGDDFVAAAFESEAVDFPLAQQGRQGAAKDVHGYTHLRSLGAVDVDYHLGLVERQVDVEEGKFA